LSHLFLNAPKAYCAVMLQNIWNTVFSLVIIPNRFEACYSSLSSITPVHTIKLAYKIEQTSNYSLEVFKSMSLCGDFNPALYFKMTTNTHKLLFNGQDGVQIPHTEQIKPITLRKDLPPHKRYI
jgi:hypothetical protein